MTTAENKPKKSERLRRLIDFIFGFENKRGDVWDQWIYSVEDFSLAPVIFMRPSRHSWPPAKFPACKSCGRNLPRAVCCLTSGFTCASWGNVWLLTLAQRRLATFTSFPVARSMSRRWSDCGIFWRPCFFFNATGGLLMLLLGLKFAFIAEIALMFALVGVLRNAGTSAFDDLDALLLRIPVIATIYEDWFRVDTYYRDDTRTLYVKLLPNLILEAAQEICAERGLKLVRQYQFPPILPELFQPLPPRTVEPK